MSAVPRARRPRLSIESLEARAVPATLVNAKTVTYTDFDGDLVTVSFSKPILTAANVNALFRFDSRGVDGDNSTPQQLQTIALLPPEARGADGTDVLISAKPTQSAGDGRVNVGAIDATGSDLGMVVVPGDLGRIRAGDTLLIDGPGLKSLSVTSMGRFGTTTQGGGDLVSEIRGPIGRIQVSSDLVATAWNQVGGGATRIGLVSIGGDCSGSFDLDGLATSVVIGGDLTGTLSFSQVSGLVSVGGSVVGGTIDVGSSAGEIRIGGSLVGGDSDLSGRIHVHGSLGRLSVGRNIVSGAGEASGVARVDGPLQSAFVGGDIVGGTGLTGGQLFLTGRVGSVRVQGDVIGGETWYSGLVYLEKGGGSVAIAGDVLGSTGTGSGGVITRQKVGSVRIGGDVRGGSGENSGRVEVDEARSVVVTGDLRGGAGKYGGTLNVDSGGTVDVRGSIRGGTAWSSGRLDVSRSVTAVHVGGDVEGGTATADGQDLDDAGSVSVGERVGRLTIDGSVIGGSSGGFANTQLAGTGQVSIGHRAETILIRGSLVGRDQRARLLAEGPPLLAGTAAEAIGTLTVLGRVERADILGGYADAGLGPAQATSAEVQLGRIVVAGDWIASNLAAGVNIETGQLAPSTEPDFLARIRSIEIGGQVLGTAADGDSYLFAAQVIGQLKVGGDTLVPTSPGAGNDLVTGLGPFADVTLKEFPAA
jgi:hypothetical protein